MLQSEFPEKHKTFLQYRDADEVEGQVLPKQQLDKMARRFEKLSTRLNELHQRLAFEEIKSRLLVNLAEIDRCIETWRSKYCSEDSVTRLLDDYQVCIVICYILLDLLYTISYIRLVAWRSFPVLR